MSLGSCGCKCARVLDGGKAEAASKAASEEDWPIVSATVQPAWLKVVYRFFEASLLTEIKEMRN